jgi:hypothetical protein
VGSAESLYHCSADRPPQAAGGVKARLNMAHWLVTTDCDTLAFGAMPSKPWKAPATSSTSQSSWLKSIPPTSFT